MKNQLLSAFSFLKLDLRSLALARILLGLVLIVDWFYRLTNSFDFYSDLGILPRGPSISQFSNPYFFSIFNMAGKPFYIYLLFLLGLLCYLGFTFGYKTKWSNILTWIFFVSLSARTPIVSHAGDDIVRLALFWFVFLPSHRFFSIDQALLDSNEKKQTDLNQTSILNIASLALMLQLLMMYFFTAILKWHPIWHTEGSAIYYALQLDQFLTLFGDMFKKLPYGFFQFMTWIVLFVEVVFPLLFFVPWKNSFFRWLMIVAFVGFHFGLFMVFRLGFFPWACMAYWAVFIPSDFWDHPKGRIFNGWLNRMMDAISLKLISLSKRYSNCIQPLRPSQNLELSHWGVQILVSFFLIITIFWNYALLEKSGQNRIPKPIEVIGSVFRLHQQWSMFAPFPAMEDGWVITEGELFNGKKWDILNDKPVNFEEPTKMSDMFKNTLWRKYLINIRSNEYKDYRLYLGRFICRLWNDRHEKKEDQVNSFKIYYMLDMSKPYGEPKAPLEKEMLWSHGCFI